MPKNEPLELYDHPPTWLDVMFFGFFGILMCSMSIILLIILFNQETDFFEVILAIILILGFGFMGMSFLSGANQDRIQVGAERKLRYIFDSASLTDYTTGQNFPWDDFLAIKGNSRNGLKFVLKVPPKTIYFYRGFSEKQRKEVVEFLKANAPHEMTWWLR